MRVAKINNPVTLETVYMVTVTRSDMEKISPVSMRIIQFCLSVVETILHLEIGKKVKLVPGSES